MSDSFETRLLVVRHGETVWNALGRQQGQLDTELNELGKAQARAAAEGLAGRGVDMLFSSDLGRARQTAEIVAARLGLDIHYDVRLRERHLGILQGMTMEEFRAKHPAEYADFTGGDVDWVIPGGECFRRQYERNTACACELANKYPGRTLAIITHGGVLECLFRHTCGLKLDAPRTFSLFNAGINEFSVIDGRWKLLRWGDTHHLLELDARDDW